MDDPFFIATTIGGNSMFALMEVEGNEKPRQGEHKISDSCLEANLATGRFTDITEQATGAYGKLYVLTEEISQE